MIYPRRSSTALSLPRVALLAAGILVLWVCFKAAVLICDDPARFMQ